MKKIILCIGFLLCSVTSSFTQRVIKNDGKDIGGQIVTGTIDDTNSGTVGGIIDFCTVGTIDFGTVTVGTIGNVGSNDNTEPDPPCSTKSMQQILSENPDYATSFQAIAEDMLFANTNTREYELDKFVIPVVFHLIFSRSENISSFDINEIGTALTKLNHYFNRDLEGEPLILPDISDSFNGEIEFRLAGLDPNGSPTNGVNNLIVDIDIDVDSIPDYIWKEPGVIPSQIYNGEVIQWPNDQYLNIYVMENLGNLSNSYGHATLPYQTHIELNTDMDSNAYFKDGVYITFDALKEVEAEHKNALAHEVGHWLGLEHIWGGSKDDDCDKDDFDALKGVVSTLDSQSLDDRFNDTPASSQSYSEFPDCAETQTSCGSVDMHDNFMSYGHCRAAFSKGQVSLMKTILQGNLLNRKKLSSYTNRKAVFKCPPPLSSDIKIIDRTNSTITFNAPDFDDVSYYFDGVSSASTSHINGDDHITIHNLITCISYIITMEVHCTAPQTTEKKVSVEPPPSGCNNFKRDINDEISNEIIGIYPNPTQGIFTLEMKNTKDVQEFFVTDITGRKMNVSSIQRSDRTMEFDGSNLDAGYYVLTVISKDGKKVSRKLIVN